MSIEDQYDEMLDEVYGNVQIAGYTYTTSHALKNVDPIAYRVGLSDYESSVEEDEIGEATDYDDEDLGMIDALLDERAIKSYEDEEFIRNTTYV